MKEVIDKLYADVEYMERELESYQKCIEQKKQDIASLEDKQEYMQESVKGLKTAIKVLEEADKR